jgi:hypothetical protein
MADNDSSSNIFVSLASRPYPSALKPLPTSQAILLANDAKENAQLLESQYCVTACRHFPFPRILPSKKVKHGYYLLLLMIVFV